MTFARSFRSVALAATLLLANVAIAQTSEPRRYVDETLAGQAVQLEAQLKQEAGRVTTPLAQLKRDALTALPRDPRTAMNLSAAAIAVDPRDAGAWLVFARAAQAVPPRDWSERYRLQERATTAAYQAYQRAASVADRAAALALLGEVHAARQSWRPALDAYRASLALAEEAPVRKIYEELREKHGFRVLDYQVDSDSASPRVCFRFSEELAPKLDATPFVAVSGRADAAVGVEGSQVCVDGLRHGERYAFVVRQGLPSAVDEVLTKPYDAEIYVRDRTPQVRFTGRNYVLPRTGQEGIPVVSVNTDRVDVEVLRIGDRNLLNTVRSEDFLSQIAGYVAEAIANERGVKVWSGSLETRRELNRDVVTAFPVLETLGRPEPGVYVMVATAPGAVANSDEYGEGYDRRATQWFVVSDLGITAFSGNDGVHVFVRSLGSAEPIAGASVRLIARNNEVLDEKTTGPTGHVRFDPGLSRGSGGLAAGLVTASLGGDYGFLDLGQAPFDLSDRGVAGRPAAGVLEAQVFPERGVYRSGETVHLTAILRDARGLAASRVPLTLVFSRPDGVEHRRVTVEDQGLGGRAFSLPILAGAMAGTWRVAAHVDPKGPAVGEAAFLVEDYVPERLELTLDPRTKMLRPGEPAQIALAARYLFGAPGAGLDITGEVVVRQASSATVPGLSGWNVGLDDEEVEASTVEIEETGVTDDSGTATMSVEIPEIAAARPLEAAVTLRVGEPGGRAVERGVTLPILPAAPVLAVRKNFDAGLSAGATATFDVVAVAPDGTRLARPGVSWSLYRVEQRYQWYNSGGRWAYEPVRSTRRVADGRIDVGADEAARVAVPVDWGTYRFEVKGEGPQAPQTSVTFSVGFSGEATADAPDLLPVELDKAAYGAGDTLRARIGSRFTGKATLAVVSDRVHEVRVVDLQAEGTEVAIPVRTEWGAGAYLVALAHRPLDVAAKRQPGRSLGLAWFSVDRAARTLQVALDVPERMRPRGALRVPVRLGGLAPGEEAYVALAAVDVGILNLTRYAAPDPAAFFFGQKRLSTEIRDVYGYIIDGMQGTRGEIRSGGDGGPPAFAAPVPAQEPLARYSGVVKVAPDGTAEVSFDIPAFNGAVRVMATAWSATKVGSAAADVVVRDPVVLAGTLPRFLNIGDRTRLHLQLDNVEGAPGEYVVEVDPSGPLLVPADALRHTVRLEAGGKAEVAVPIVAAGAGLSRLAVRLVGPDLDVAQSFALALQPGSGPMVRRDVRPLEPGAAMSVSRDLLDGVLAGTGAVSVSVSPLAALDVPGLLRSLDRYPYGCSEQIVSRALPLLYVNRLAAAENFALDGALDARIRDAIARVLARQDSSGSFGLWSVGGSQEAWLDAYVTDFLTRARERGFDVPARAFDQALDRLRNYVANTTENDGERGVALAYAAYVLARNGRPVMGDLRYLADTRMAAFATPLARGQIAAALALLGDRGRARTAFAAAVASLSAARDDRSYRGDYGSRLRDGAGLLALVSEAGFTQEHLAATANVIGEERAQRVDTSTQENAWMVLAAQGLLADAEAITLSVGGDTRQGAYYRTLPERFLATQDLSLRNLGRVPVQVSLTVTGNPVDFEPAASRGYEIARKYYRLDGTEIDPSAVRQNDRLVVVLSLTEPETKPARLLVVDRLPAGFEIDNPSLVDSGSVGALDWLTREVEPVQVEYRDDRFVAAFDRQSGQSPFITIAYMVRAVSPGRFVHPPAVAEDMYRPERFGRTAFGSVEVAPAR